MSPVQIILACRDWALVLGAVCSTAVATLLVLGVWWSVLRLLVWCLRENYALCLFVAWLAKRRWERKRPKS